MKKCPRQLPKSHSNRAFMVCKATMAWTELPLPSPTRPEWSTAKVPLPDITGPFQRCPSHGPLHQSWTYETDQSRRFWCSCRSVYILLQHLTHHIHLSLSSFWYLKGTSTMLWRCPGTYPCYQNTSQGFLKIIINVFQKNGKDSLRCWGISPTCVEF